MRSAVCTRASTGTGGRPGAQPPPLVAPPAAAGAAPAAPDLPPREPRPPPCARLRTHVKYTSVGRQPLGCFTKEEPVNRDGVVSKPAAGTTAATSSSAAHSESAMGRKMAAGKAARARKWACTRPRHCGVAQRCRLKRQVPRGVKFPCLLQASCSAARAHQHVSRYVKCGIQRSRKPAAARPTRSTAHRV